MVTLSEPALSADHERLQLRSGTGVPCATVHTKQRRKPRLALRLVNRGYKSLIAGAPVLAI